MWGAWLGCIVLVAAWVGGTRYGVNLPEDLVLGLEFTLPGVGSMEFQLAHSDKVI